MKIKPPSRIGNLPRSKQEREKYKGKECEFQLLQMVGVDNNIVYYCSLFVKGLYILLI